MPWARNVDDRLRLKLRMSRSVGPGLLAGVRDVVWLRDVVGCRGIVGARVCALSVHQATSGRLWNGTLVFKDTELAEGSRSDASSTFLEQRYVE